MSLEAIGNQLATLCIERGDLLHDRVFCKSRMAEIELDLLKDGVEGKNEEIRKLNRANILLADDEWRALDRIGRDNEARLLKVEAQIAAYEAQRRGSVTATLDGSVSVYDGGYSFADQTLKCSINRPSKVLLEALRYLVAYYGQVITCCEIGAFMAVPSFALVNDKLTIQLRLVSRLDS